MPAHYPFLGEKQPKNLCVGGYLNVGNLSAMREVNKEDFANRVLRRLEQRGMSQSAAAHKLGIKQQTMHNVCKGKVENPRFINELAEILQTTRVWLLYGDGPEDFIPPGLRNKATEALAAVDDTRLMDAIDALEALREPEPRKPAQKAKSRAKRRAA